MSDAPLPATRGTQGVRIFSWLMVTAVLVFLINNYLSFWRDWPGAGALLAGEGGLLSGLQIGLYALALIGTVLYVSRSPGRALRADAAVMSRGVKFFIRWAFFAVLLVGLADIAVSFLRVEELLPAQITQVLILLGTDPAAAATQGTEIADAWGFNANRAPQVHLPLIGVALLLAIVLPTLGFHWLAVLVVLAELSIVITRFIFSYEQAFQGDLVRFWYGALFLFASAYTLLEDGHVRVDVFYAGLSSRTQGALNSFGCLVMGILFCWVVLYLGMATKSSVINAPLQSLEVTQAGFGMYVKYLMAGFLAIFGVSMMIQFSAYLLESVADWRGDPGGRAHHLHGHDGDHPSEV
ncbi:MAG: TRAP transporter small permease subunit [Pseudomonadota bacterium]